MSWWSATPAIVAAFGVLYLPGTVVLLAARRWTLRSFALAPAISVGIVAVSAIIGSFVGVRWSWAVPAVGVVLVAGVAGVLRFLAARHVPTRRFVPSKRWVWTVAGVLLGAFLIGRRLIPAIGDPQNISQTYDGVFHLNAIRYILDTGSGSSLDVGHMTGLSYYPSAWHDVVSLVVQLTGAAIPVAINATTLVICSLVWPAGCVYLARVVFPRPNWAATAAGILSSAFGAFPLHLVSFGVLYPNGLAVALLPAALGFTMRLLRLPPSSDAVRRSPASATVLNLGLLAVALVGVALAHPNGFMSWVALAWPLLLWWSWARVSAAWKSGARIRRRAALQTGSILFSAVIITLALWHFVRPPEAAAVWLATQSPGQAVGEVLGGSQLGRPVTFFVMALIVAGLVTAIRRPAKLWVCGPFFMAGVLFVVASGMPESTFRMWLTGVWYNDPSRLAALLPIGSLLVALLGAIAIVGIVQGVFATDKLTIRIAGRASRAIAPSAAVLGMLVMVAGTQGPGVRQAGVEVRSSFTMSNSSPLLSTDEYKLIERLPQTTPPDALILENPWTGGALAYGLVDRNVTEKHLAADVPPDVLKLDADISRIDTDPAVCAAVRSTGVDYVLDFGKTVVNRGERMVIDYSGFKGLKPGEHLRLVDSQGGAKLYEVVGCG